MTINDSGAASAPNEASLLADEIEEAIAQLERRKTSIGYYQGDIRVLGDVVFRNSDAIVAALRRTPAPVEAQAVEVKEDLGQTKSQIAQSRAAGTGKPVGDGVLQEISDAWQMLESFGFPPEACGWPFQSIEGELPNAIKCALECIIRQRDKALASTRGEVGENQSPEHKDSQQ